jgi:hypothetical protein
MASTPVQVICLISCLGYCTSFPKSLSFLAPTLQCVYIYICVCVCVFIFFAVVGIEPRALWMWGKHSTTDLHLQSLVFFFLLLCCLGVQCGIYRSSYNVSNISYWNSPPSWLFFTLPPFLEWFQEVSFLHLHTCVHIFCTVFTLLLLSISLSYCS